VLTIIHLWKYYKTCHFLCTSSHWTRFQSHTWIFLSRKALKGYVSLTYICAPPLYGLSCALFEIFRIFRIRPWRWIVLPVGTRTFCLRRHTLTWGPCPSFHSSFLACSSADPRVAKRPWSRAVWICLSSGPSTWCSGDCTRGSVAASTGTPTGTWPRPLVVVVVHRR